MKSILVLIYCSIISWGYSQPDSVRFYTLEELKGARPDTVLAITIRKQKLDSLPTELFQFKNLQYLDAGKNKLSNVTRLSAFPRLIYLNLEKNELDYFPVAICSLPNLRELIINRNNFSSIPECIEYASSLVRIDLWSVPITDLPISMTNLKDLKEIDLSEVRMGPSLQQKLKSMFPNVNLILDPPCDCME